jgi:SAM-dependent methyltransferase
MNKAKRLINLCETFALNAVRDLLVNLNINKTKIATSPHWGRLVNFALSNQICEFDLKRLPIKIAKPSAAQPITRLIRTFATKSDPNSVILLSRQELGELDEVLNECEPQPFIIVKNGVKLKDNWAHLFDESDPQSIKRWLRNYFEVSVRFLNRKNLENAVVTGHTQWSAVFGEKIRSVFDLKNFDAGLFTSVMAAMHEANQLEAETLLPIVGEFSSSSFLDVGGSTGALARAYAEKYPERLVRIYENEATLALIENIVSELRLNTPANLQYISGDFFKSANHAGLFALDASAKFDLITLGWILHDWQDADAVTILKRVSKHLAANGKLILLEKPLEPNGQGAATLLDLTMLLQTGGRERTLAEYVALASQCNLKFEKLITSDLRRDYLVFGPAKSNV